MSSLVEQGARQVLDVQQLSVRFETKERVVDAVRNL